MKTICIFGESTTWGASDWQKGGWANRLRFHFDQLDDPHWKAVYTLGIHGDTSHDLLNRFETEARARNPDIIILSTGGNDASYIKSEDKPKVSLDEFRKNIEKLVELSRKFTNKIVFLGLRNINDSLTKPIQWDKTMYYSNDKMKQYDQVLKKVCEKNKVYFIDFYGFMEKNDFGEDDGLHPNEKGHEKIYKKVKDFLIKNKII